MPAAPETLRAIDDARASVERLFHAYSGACTKSVNKQARDLFGRLAAWEMHHFEEIDRAAATLAETATWVDYAPLDFEKAETGASDDKDQWDRAGLQYFNEAEALSSALDNERANYTLFLGLAAKARDPKERDFWTGIAAEEELHAKVLKEQLDHVKGSGSWTWLDVLKKGAPKASVSAVKMAVKTISPLSESELRPSQGTPGKRIPDGDTETALLPPGWEALSPDRTKPFRVEGWEPPPLPESGLHPAPPAAPAASGWVTITPDHPGGEPTAKTPPAPGVPAAPFSPTDTAIMDRPLAQTGGKWSYEVSVKTAEQLAGNVTIPRDVDVRALISGPARKSFIDILNRRGAQGWELLQLAFPKGAVVFFWKRRA